MLILCTCFYMEKDYGLVSIIMAYYNAEKYVFDAVNSIIDQSYNNWELIIVNDCSTSEKTDLVLQKIKSLDSKIKIIKTQKNCGAGGARNCGIKECNGKYLAFLDSDDWWYPTKLEEQISFMAENGYVFTCTYYQDTDQNLNPYYEMHQKLKQNITDLIRDCNIGTPGVIINIEKLGKVYMPPLRSSEDHGLWIELLKRVDYIFTYSKALWKYRHLNGSESSNKLKMMKGLVKMYKYVLGYSSIKAWSVCIFVLLPRNIIKKCRKIF